MSRRRAKHANRRERGGKDDEVPVPGMSRGWQDQPIGSEVPRSDGEALRCTPWASQGSDVHTELLASLRTAQVDDPDVPHVEAPEATTLAGWIDGTARGGVPLRPDGLDVERGVERPGVAGSVAARIGGCRAIGRQRGRVEARLAMHPAAERAERAQM